MTRSLSKACLLLCLYLLLCCHKTRNAEEITPVESSEKPNAEEVEKNPSVPFNEIEEFPIFSGCEDAVDKKPCTDKKLLEYIYKNLRFRPFKQGESPGSKLLIKFTIEIDGSTSHLEVVQGQSTLQGSNIEEVIEQMPRWTPGKKAGKPTRTRFNLPMNIHFE